MNELALVQKVWNYAHVLRDQGVPYQAYISQISYLLFLKMCHERTQPPFNEESRLPAGLDWPALIKLKGTDLEAEHLYTIIFYKGMTGLRIAENDNCVMCRGEGSCIFPLAPAALVDVSAGYPGFRAEQALCAGV